LPSAVLIAFKRDGKTLPFTWLLIKSEPSLPMMVQFEPESTKPSTSGLFKRNLTNGLLSFDLLTKIDSEFARKDPQKSLTTFSQAFQLSSVRLVIVGTLESALEWSRDAARPEVNRVSTWRFPNGCMFCHRNIWRSASETKQFLFGFAVGEWMVGLLAVPTLEGFRGFVRGLVTFDGMFRSVFRGAGAWTCPRLVAALHVC
jgi:hypothetical protein